MKLTKIKLINWHIFTNSTIEMNGNTLITGENASGKSTLMDAIYFVLSGGDQNHFNKAANDAGQRNLETYVRGKLGTERMPFLRPENDVISYIILEFKDNRSKKSLVLGSEIEIVSAARPKVNFFVIDDYSINESDFIKDKRVLDFRTIKSNFKSSNYELTSLPDSQKERKKVIGRDIFKLDNYKRFFDLLQNAISFKPISEVSTFVNGFLLDEDNINLDSLRDEIRSYQEIHRLLIKEQEKIDSLKEFTPKAEKYVKNIEELKYVTALRTDTKIEKNNNIINRSKIELDRLKDEFNGLKLEDKTLSEDRDRFNKEIIQLENNESYQAVKEKKNLLKEKNNQLNLANNKLDEFKTKVFDEQKRVRKLKLTYRFDDDIKNKDFGLLNSHLKKYSLEIEKKDDDIRNESAKLRQEYFNNKEEIDSKKKELLELKQGINNYPEDVKNLIDIAKNAIISFNPKEKNVDVRPFCEFIELNDPKWTDALEGYLNTRRFNLIFDPKYYDVVSEAYDRYKSQKKVYISGIVNVNKIPSCKEERNSLFSKITIKNKYASKYAAFLLGDLICCDDVKELKNYNSSISPSVMVYKNFVLKATDPKVYRVPFVGKESREKRMALLETEINEMIQHNLQIEEKAKNYKEIIDIIKASNVGDLIKTDNYWKQIEILEKQINDIENEIKQTEADNGLIALEDSISLAKNNLRKVTDKFNENADKENKNIENQGKIKERIESETIILENNKKLLSEQQLSLNLDLYQEKHDSYLSNGWLDELRINSDFESAQKYNNSINSSLLETMQKYTSTYKASLSPLIENIQDYINEYYDLVNRGVVEFEREAHDAYVRAEYSFKEDFISKLKEKIEKSQKMLDKLNKTLKNHPFGSEKEIYEFHYAPTKNSEFYNYYRIITSGKMMESHDLLTEILDAKDSEILKDLFGKISMETNSSEAEAELQRYLDYRNYMDFDIKIINKDGDQTFFSKINKEKSGGETQTPFYIVMASCFDELMNKDSNKVESTCQVVFDEAFNNMDESRIKSLMEFYKNLNIQVIIIVPSNRISAISPYMDTMIGIAKINNHPQIITSEKI